MGDDLPEQIGDYEVLGRLGRGKFADVFRVQAEDGSEYALKRNLIDEESHLERLRNELVVLRDLDCQGIPRLVAAGKPEAPYIVMDLMPGETLEASRAEKAERGAVHGDIETLQILRGLLRILAYLAENDVVHRDIKAANVLATRSASRVSLIDFGFSKSHQASQIRMDDSFFRAGAVRYSPPAKIENPGTADASHDVFAAGVLGYLLLTGDFPWSVAPTADLGVYRQHLLHHRPAPAHERNPYVGQGIGEFIASLLRLDDSRRPTAAAALAQADLLLQATTTPRQGQGRVAYPRVLRDPLYGDIRLTPFEHEVFMTPELQRLRYVKQLGLTNYIYPGAEHSRLSHALGCLYRVEQILSTIEAIEGIGIDPDSRAIARLYALTHDVTHVAFGHTLEDELGIFTSHDDNEPRRRRLLLDSGSGLGTKLREQDIGRRLLEHFDLESTVIARTGVPHLVTGDTGADVLDYVDRDAYHCGLDHRVDSAIFRQLRWYSSDDRGEPELISLMHAEGVLRVDREYAVESLLAERYAMFLKVYTHPTKIAASALLGKALAAAMGIPSSRGSKADFTEEEYEWFADAEVLSRLRASRKAVPRELGDELRRGVLPRPVYRAQLLGDTNLNRDAYAARLRVLREGGYLEPGRRAELEAELARQVGLDPAEVVLYCPATAPGLQEVKHGVLRPGRPASALDPASPLLLNMDAKHLRLWGLWAFTRSEDHNLGAELARVVEDRLGLPNLIDQNRRDGRLW